MKQKDDSTWQRNAGSQIVLDSIFAALAGIWITIATADGIHTKLKFIEVLCSLFSFFFLAVSAEGTINACDERDVLKYVYYLFWYNIGVIFVGAAIGALVFTHFEVHLVRFVGSGLWRLSPLFITIIILLGYIAFFVMLLWNWIRDACWILCEDSEKFNNYLRELNDDADPELDRGRVMSTIFKRRIKNEPDAT
jgi:hypothetical protein